MTENILIFHLDIGTFTRSIACAVLDLLQWKINISKIYLGAKRIDKYKVNLPLFLVKSNSNVSSFTLERREIYIFFLSIVTTIFGLFPIM